MKTYENRDHVICNQWVGSSSLSGGTTIHGTLKDKFNLITLMGSKWVPKNIIFDY